MTSGDTGHITGTPDKDYNIIWFVEACLSNALRLETYIDDAERAGDSELAAFFQRALLDPLVCSAMNCSETGALR